MRGDESGCVAGWALDKCLLIGVDDRRQTNVTQVWPTLRMWVAGEGGWCLETGRTATRLFFLDLCFVSGFYFSSVSSQSPDKPQPLHCPCRLFCSSLERLLASTAVVRPTKSTDQ